jgi:succinoglycan biosynthesis protein ExoL
MTSPPFVAPRDGGERQPGLKGLEARNVAAPAPAARPVRIAYFAHNLHHADIPRRVAMLTLGGAEVRVLGFHRGERPAGGPAEFVVDLGRTQDAKLLARVVSVLKALATLPRWIKAIAGSQAIVARNLEMLALAAVARSLGAPRARLIYECLDIHRVMSGQGAASAAMRSLERFLLARADALMVSSPGFAREYFATVARDLPPVVLVENKVGVTDAVPAREQAAIPPGPPWRIGWFGVIRCRRSLELLIEAARRHPGLLEVVIAGRPATDVVGDLARELPEGCGVRFVGPFADEAALAALNRSVHFAWLVDFYEAGANSDWLLPNRLYRSVYYGAVPIALKRVETGRWLEARGAGLLLDEASANSVAGLLAGLTPADYLATKASLERIPSSALVSRRQDCTALVEQLAAPGPRLRSHEAGSAVGRIIT